MVLKNKVAIVTGAAQGIGKAIAGKLAGAGAKVFILDYNIEVAEKTAEEMRQKGLDCIAKKCDVSDVPFTQNLAREIIAEVGKIDILVNNAGIVQNKPVWELTEADWDRVMSVNLRGPFFLTQVIFQHMMEQRDGAIINIASLSAERGGKFAGINYSCSKGGVIAMTKSLALVGGEYGIRVNAIAPGLIKTAMGDQLNFNTDAIPLGRLGEADEVGDAVLFLASNASSYVSGTILDLNGGEFMR